MNSTNKMKNYTASTIYKEKHIVATNVTTWRKKIFWKIY